MMFEVSYKIAPEANKIMAPENQSPSENPNKIPAKLIPKAINPKIAKNPPKKLKSQRFRKVKNVKAATMKIVKNPAKAII